MEIAIAPAVQPMIETVSSVSQQESQAVIVELSSMEMALVGGGSLALGFY